MIEGGAVAELLGAIVLGATDDDRVRGRMLIDELELGDADSFVDAVVPRGPAVRGFVDAAVASRIDDEMIGRIAGERMIVGMNCAADLRHGPDAPGVHSL